MTTANSGPSNLQALRMQSHAKEEEEKAKAKRKKGAIVLIQQFLLDHGFLEASAAVERETGVSMGRHSPADNMGLLQILQEHEVYYDMRFGTKPKYYRVTDGTDAGGGYAGGGGEMMKNKPRVSSADTKNGVSRAPRPGPSKPSKERQPARGTPPTELTDLCPTATPINVQDKEPRKKSLAKDDIEAEGAAFAVRQRLLRPLPLSEWNSDMRELAAVIQNDILDSNPNVRWDDVAALNDAKQLLREAVVMPAKYPQFFHGTLRPWKGILLFGPPGTGKTMLAKAVATECSTTFFNISASTIVSKWRGDSEKLIRMLFEMARHYSPSTIFLDELDSIMSQRSSAGQEHEGSRRMKTELLIQMDGIHKDPENKVFVLGASNIPWDLDGAVLRRMEKRILVGMPTVEARKFMFRENLKGHIDESSIDFDCLSQRTEGYTGSDINVVCREAMMRTVRAKMLKLERCGNEAELEKELVSLDKVTMVDLVNSLAVTKASSHSIPLKKYVEWEQGYGSGASKSFPLDSLT